MQYQPNTLKQTIVLGVFFLLLVTTYASFSNIITFIFEHDSTQFSFVGQLSLILNYFVYLIGLSKASGLKNYKRQFIIAAICYSANYALYILDLNEVMRLIVSILGSIIGGYGASILWVSQGGYMMRLFRRYKITENQQGHYLGIQNGILYFHIFCGGLITTFALGVFGNLTYFIVLTGVGLLALVFCFFFLDPLQGHSEEQLVQDNKQELSFFQEFKNVVKYYPTMKYIMAALVLDGVLLGFTTTNFSQLLPSDLKSDINVGILHISNGLGGLIGGYLSGSLSDNIPVTKQGVMLFLFNIFTLLLTILKQFIAFTDIWFAVVVTFLWGICFCFLQGWLFVCCVKLYQGKIESFAIVKQMHTFSFIIFQIYVLLCNNKINVLGTIIFMIILSIISIVSCHMAGLQNKYQLKQQIGQISPAQPQ